MIHASDSEPSLISAAERSGARFIRLVLNVALHDSMTVLEPEPDLAERNNSRLAVGCSSRQKLVLTANTAKV